MEKFDSPRRRFVRIYIPPAGVGRGARSAMPERADAGDRDEVGQPAFVAHASRSSSRSNRQRQGAFERGRSPTGEDVENSGYAKLKLRATRSQGFDAAKTSATADLASTIDSYGGRQRPTPPRGGGVPQGGSKRTVAPDPRLAAASNEHRDVREAQPGRNRGGPASLRPAARGTHTFLNRVRAHYSADLPSGSAARSVATSSWMQRSSHQAGPCQRKAAGAHRGSKASTRRRTFAAASGPSSGRPHLHPPRRARPQATSSTCSATCHGWLQLPQGRRAPGDSSPAEALRLDQPTARAKLVLLRRLTSIAASSRTPACCRNGLMPSSTSAAPEHVFPLRGNHETTSSYDAGSTGGVKPGRGDQKHAGAVRSPARCREYMTVRGAAPNMLSFDDVMFRARGDPGRGTGRLSRGQRSPTSRRSRTRPAVPDGCGGSVGPPTTSGRGHPGPEKRAVPVRAGLAVEAFMQPVRLISIMVAAATRKVDAGFGPM